MASSTDFDRLFAGNEAFKRKYGADFFEKQYDGQQPPFMFLGCADSRVSEGTVFEAPPGVLFTERNIANQFRFSDNNVQSALAFAVDALGVRHVVVMGHYNCGGCYAAMGPRPAADHEPLSFGGAAVRDWIEPIRLLYATSDRPEIVAHRLIPAEQCLPVDVLKGAEEDHQAGPALKALVEENVGITVQRIYESQTIRDHYGKLTADGGVQPVFIHGLVYDLRHGRVLNLGVSVGPPGFDVPNLPFQPVAGSRL